MKKMEGLSHTEWAKHKKNANRRKKKNGYNQEIRRNIKRQISKA